VRAACILLWAAACSQDRRPPTLGRDPDRPTWQGGPVACGAGDVECVGGVAWTCNDTGDGYLPGDDCVLRGQSCEDGIGCRDCIEKERFCHDDEPYLCEGGRLAQQPVCEAPAVCFGGRCSDVCAQAALGRSYSGCEYFAVDLPNVDVSGGGIEASPANAQYAVVVSNADGDSSANVEAWTGLGADDERLLSQRVPPHATAKLLLGPANPPAFSGTTARAFRVVSDRPVTAYQFNPLNNTSESFSNDASLLLPTTALGPDYVAVTGDAILGSASPYEPAPVNWGAFVAVVGVSETATRVTVEPSAPIADGGELPGGLGPYEVVLERYQVLVLESDAGSDPDPAEGNGNLSGTRITADRPVAAFSGNLATIVPTGPDGTCCADHLEEQLFPLASWGRSFVAPRSWVRRPSDPEADYYRVTAGDEPVTLSWIPAAPAGAPASLAEFESALFRSTADFGVSGTARFLLTKFLTSSDQVSGEAPCDPAGDASECPLQPALCAQAGSEGVCLAACTPGPAEDVEAACGFAAVCDDWYAGGGWCQPLSDPAMIGVPPIEQYRSRYFFLTPDDYARDYVDVVAPAGASVSIDGTALEGFTPVGDVAGTEWLVARSELALDGTHVVEADRPVALLVYGWDRYVSYGYPAGLDLVEIVE